MHNTWLTAIIFHIFRVGKQDNPLTLHLKRGNSFKTLQKMYLNLKHDKGLNVILPSGLKTLPWPGQRWQPAPPPTEVQPISNPPFPASACHDHIKGGCCFSGASPSSPLCVLKSDNCNYFNFKYLSEGKEQGYISLFMTLRGVLETA